MTTDGGETKRSVDGKVDWQEALRQRHREWLDDPLPSFAVGDGWAGVVDELFDEIREILLRHAPGTRLSVSDVKEKYGGLRLSWMGPVDDDTEAAIERSVLAAERRSERVCDVCGERGGMRTSRPREGWLAVRCDDHSGGFPHPADD